MTAQACYSSKQPDYTGTIVTALEENGCCSGEPITFETMEKIRHKALDMKIEPLSDGKYYLRLPGGETRRV